MTWLMPFVYRGARDILTAKVTFGNALKGCKPYGYHILLGNYSLVLPCFVTLLFFCPLLNVQEYVFYPLLLLGLIEVPSAECCLYHRRLINTC